MQNVPMSQQSLICDRGTHQRQPPNFCYPIPHNGNMKMKNKMYVTEYGCIAFRPSWCNEIKTFISILQKFALYLCHNLLAPRLALPTLFHVLCIIFHMNIWLFEANDYFGSLLLCTHHI